MSRAFLKETEVEEVAPVPPPALPPGVPNHITPAGVARFKAERVVWMEERAGLRGRETPEARARLGVITARLAWIEARTPTWVETAPPARPTTVSFGCTVEVETEDGGRRTLTLVGVDEVEPAAGRVSFLAPVARALIGAEVGDAVTVTTPRGEEGWTVLVIRAA